MRAPQHLLLPHIMRTVALSGCSAYCTMSVHAPSASRSLATSTTTAIAATTATVTAPPRPHFAFGVIADVQWADEDDGSNYGKTVVRRYRGAFRALGRAVDWWRALPAPPAFVAQLGDLIDGRNAARAGASASALEAALAELRRAPCRAVNLVGNHEVRASDDASRARGGCSSSLNHARSNDRSRSASTPACRGDHELYNFDRAALARAPWLAHGDREFYSFSPAAGWRVAVLDPCQASPLGAAADRYSWSWFRRPFLLPHAPRRRDAGARSCRQQLYCKNANTTWRHAGTRSRCSATRPTTRAAPRPSRCSAARTRASTRAAAAATGSFAATHPGRSPLNTPLLR